MARPMLYHRSPAVHGVPARGPGRPALAASRPSSCRMLMAGSGTVGDGRRGLQLPARGRQGGRHPRRQVRRALGQDLRRPTASSASSSTSSGARASIRRWSPKALDENPGVRAVYATASRDVDGDQARRRGARQGGEGEGTTSSSASTRSPRSACTTCRSTSGASTSSCVGSQKALMLPPGLAIVGGLRQGLEGERAREPAALLPGPRCASGRARRRARPRSRRRCRWSSGCANRCAC